MGARSRCALILLWLMLPTVAFAEPTPVARGVQARSGGDLEGALNLLRCPNGVDPEPVRLFEYAITLSWASRLDEALTVTEQLLALEPQSLPGLNAKARILHWLGNSNAALSVYERVLQIEPSNREARLGMADVARADLDFTRSRALYTQLLVEDRRDEEARKGMVRVDEDARTEHEVALGAAHTDAWRAVGYGRTSVRLGRHWTLLGGYRADSVGLPWTSGTVTGFTHAGDLGIKSELSRRVTLSLGYGVLSAPGLLAHGPRAEGAVRVRQNVALIASAAPTFRTGAAFGVLASVGAVLSREGPGFVMVQIFHYRETVQSPSTAFALSGESPRLGERLGVRLGASVAFVQDRELYTLWAEPRLTLSSHFEAFARAEQNLALFERTALLGGVGVRL